MGQCGCGDMHLDYAYRLHDGTVLAIERYPGCAGCNTGPYIQLYQFPNDQNSWLAGIEISDAPTIDPDGIRIWPWIELPSQEDMQAARAEIEAEAGTIGLSDSQYESLRWWFDDNGMEWMNRAYFKMWERLATPDHVDTPTGAQETARGEHPPSQP